MTYKTMVDGYANAKYFKEHLNLYDKMKCENTFMLHHTLVAVYAKFKLVLMKLLNMQIN